MKKTVAAIVAAVMCFTLASCSGNLRLPKAKKSASADFFAMDTYMRITAYGENAETAVDESVKLIKRLDLQLSVSNKDSEIYFFNSGGELWSKESDVIMLAADNLHKMTDGAFDVRILPVVEAWGFFSGDYRVPDENELRELLKNRDKLDFGGIAKGYASDEAADIMRNCGVESALIALGGNIYAIGSTPEGKPWRIAVQNPFDLSAYAGILNLTDTAAVTSGAYQRFFELDGVIYHHIIDPHTGYPADSGLSSVTVVSMNATLADGLSTGLFILGKDRALEIWRENSEQFDLVLIENSGAVTITKGLEGSFESENIFEIVR